jgi:hypothetical protein
LGREADRKASESSNRNIGKGIRREYKKICGFNDIDENLMMGFCEGRKGTLGDDEVKKFVSDVTLKVSTDNSEH